MTDLKLSITENVKARLPSSYKFHTDPPEGTFERPYFALAFKVKQPSKDSYIGMPLNDYEFEAEIGVEQSEDNPQTATDEKFSKVDNLFVENEELSYWHFSGKAKYLREGRIKVKKFNIQEGKKDREKDTIKATLIVTY
jgi:hypothetical protein